MAENNTDWDLIVGNIKWVAIASVSYYFYSQYYGTPLMESAIKTLTCEVLGVYAGANFVAGRAGETYSYWASIVAVIILLVIMF